MYGKIYESTFTGSMVGSGAVVFAVWSYVIAHVKPPGVVELNAALLGPVLGCPVGDVEKALEVLCAPDERSRTPDHEGRRLLREGQFLYRVPTWGHYHAMRNDDERRAYNREAQRKSRSQRAVKHDVNDSQHPSATVSHGQPMQDAVRSTQYTEAPLDAVRGDDSSTAAQRKWAPRPDDVSESVWQDWIAHRKAIKAPFSATALAQTRTEAAKAGMALDQALSTAMASGWRGFRADYVRKLGTKPAEPPRNVTLSAMPKAVLHDPDDPACKCERCYTARLRANGYGEQVKP